MFSKNVEDILDIDFLSSEPRLDTNEKFILEGWLPSESTQKLLKSVSVDQKDSANYTLPGLFKPEFNAENNSINQIKKLFISLKYSPEEAESFYKPISLEKVSPDEEGLMFLIKNGWYIAACDLTHRLLTNCGHGLGQTGQNTAILTEYSAHLWLIRFNLLIKLAQFDIADREMDAFNSMEAPDIYYQAFPSKYGNRKGSIIPFSLRILHAILPYYLNKKRESIEKIYLLIHTINSILKNIESGYSEDGSVEVKDSKLRKNYLYVWLMRKLQLYQLSSWLYFSIGDYESSIISAEECLKLSESLSIKTETINITAGIGRIYLTVGNVGKAEEYFEKSLTYLNPEDPDYFINKNLYLSMVHVAKGEYLQAKGLVFEALRNQRESIRLLNNIAVIEFYLGNISTAISYLERIVEMDGKLVTDKTVSDLCMMYELESGNAIHKKKILLGKLASTCADRIKHQSFKILDQ